jgi:hypothetical protein
MIPPADVRRLLRPSFPIVSVVRLSKPKTGHARRRLARVGVKSQF